MLTPEGSTKRAAEEAEMREKEFEEAKSQRYAEEYRTEKAEVKRTAGGGTGGYIIVDLQDKHRSLFHDLLKGFEEYAQLKGYKVAFSVDSTFSNRIAFKFTVTDPEIVVGATRVRSDFEEYLKRIKDGESLDDLPVVVSFEEHNLLVTTLKNRMSFLQNNYDLAKNSADFYNSLLWRAREMPLLPAQSVVVQTGGALNAPTYTATNSPQALLGESNQANQSIYIASSFNQRQQQITHIEKALAELKRDPRSEETDEVARTLANVKEELESAEVPDEGRISAWLEKARHALKVGSLGHDTVKAAKDLFRIFGVEF